MITVVVADDHHLVRQGIRALLENAYDIQVVGEAQDGLQAVQMVEQLAPDVLVIDVKMPRMNGLEATVQIREMQSDTQIVILSMYSDEPLVKKAFRNGARGYLLKESVRDELLLAIRTAHRCETYLSPIVSNKSIAELTESTGQTATFKNLSRREREVLQMVAEGLTNNAIAIKLGISSRTVEKHRAACMAKLRVNNLADLIRVAMIRGLVIIDQSIEPF